MDVIEAYGKIFGKDEHYKFAKKKQKQKRKAKAKGKCLTLMEEFEGTNYRDMNSLQSFAFILTGLRRYGLYGEIK